MTDWVSDFLNTGREKGFGDLSMMVGKVSEIREAAKRQGATEALEGLIASATTKHEQDGVTMTWATSTKNEMLRAAEDMLSAIKADFSNPPQ